MVEVIKYQTPNCRPCRLIQFTLDRIHEQLKDKPITFTVVDAMQEPERTQAAGITSAPTVVVFKDGNEIHRFVGGHHKDADFLAVIEPLLQ